MPDFQQQYSLWDEFLTAWPVSRLASMTVDEYTRAGSKDSFTYWIESRLDEMGSIWGGSAFKFGVFSRKDTQSKSSDAKHRDSAQRLMLADSSGRQFIYFGSVSFAANATSGLRLTRVATLAFDEPTIIITAIMDGR